MWISHQFNKEHVAKTIAKEKYNKSNLIYTRLSFIVMIKNVFLLNQNTHIYDIFMIIYKNWLKCNQQI